MLPEAELIQLYRDTIRPLYAYVSRRVGGNRSLAEDLVQDTWLRALDAWPSRGVPHEPIAWLIRVARNALVSHFRRVTPIAVDPALLDLEAGALPVDTPDVAAVVNWALARLRPAHAALIEAFHFDERSVRDIAQANGLSERAVEGQLRRARLKLKKHLQPMLRSAASATREDRQHARSTRP